MTPYLNINFCSFSSGHLNREATAKRSAEVRNQFNGPAPKKGKENETGGTHTIDRVNLSSRFLDNSKRIAARGYTPDWPEAIAGHGRVIDNAHGTYNLTIFSVPFIDEIHSRHAAIIGGVLQSRDDSLVQEFITTSYLTQKSISIGPNLSAACGDDIEPLIRVIASGSRPEIWKYILSGITIPDSSIRKAFESQGFSCSSAPIGFPDKSIWYAATCILEAH
jgi:hypothetical protein